MKTIEEVLEHLTLNEKTAILFENVENAESSILEALLELKTISGEDIEEAIDHIITQDGLIDLDDHPSLTDRERNE